MNKTTRRFATVSSLALLIIATAAVAQPPGGGRGGPAFDVGRQLPLEGAPLAIPGPYAVVDEPAFGAPGFRVWRPADLSAFPSRDTLPVMAWGNGGCAIDATRYGGFLSTIASHGFLVISTVPAAGAPARGAAPAADAPAGGGRGGRGGGATATPDMMRAALDWAEAEATRAGSPLNGKIATDKMAVMGQSCGGFMSIEVGADPRVGTVGVFNSGVQPPNPAGGRGMAGTNATTDSLKELHGPVLFINGGEVDFMYEASRANYELITTQPAFYGARENAGHTATVLHPGGGEFANVASNWLRYVFKNDAEAGKMFVGDDCGLCQLPTWETASKGLK